MYMVWCTVSDVNCTMYTVRCTMYDVHSTMYTVCCTLYNIHCTLYTVQCILYAVHCTLYALRCTLFALSCTFCVVKLKQHWNLICFIIITPTLVYSPVLPHIVFICTVLLALASWNSAWYMKWTRMYHAFCLFYSVQSLHCTAVCCSLFTVLFTLFK